MSKKYRKYKNFLEKFLDSNSGKRFFNIAYSVGASIVIIGAMAKILHWRFGDELLMIGMITEAIVFLISAFEKPDKEYKWEEVYPILADNEDFVPKAERLAQQSQPAASQSSGTPAIQSTATPSGNLSSGSSSSGASSPINTGNIPASSPTGAAGTTGSGGGSTVVIGGSSGSRSAGTSGTTPSSPVSGSGTAGNITIIGGSNSSTGSHAGGVVDVSDSDVAQLAQMTENMEKFAKVTDSLAKIADSLQVFIGQSNGIEDNTQGYAAQLEALNRNIAGLNTIYEVQLKGISGQIHTIEHINAGLDRIKKLYDGSLADSSIFKNETEKMAQQLSELNHVYARLLQAMTTNMNMGGGFNPNLGGGNTPTQP